MTLNDFITKWTNQTVDTDGIYPNQCMDLAHEYVKDVLGLPVTLLAHPSAYQVFTDFTETQYFDKIANTPTGIPQAGDLVVFGQQIGTDGHICIFVSGDTKTFKSFDANWPIGSLPHIEDHNYSGVSGWLHPKDAPTGSTDALSVCLAQHTELVNLCNQKDETIKNLNDQLGEQKELVKQKELQLSTQEVALTSKDKTIETLQEQANKVDDLTTQLTQAKNDRMLCLAAQESQNKQIAQHKAMNYQVVDASKLIKEIFFRIFG